VELIGDVISHYRILRKIGSGGMGEVYLAEDTELRRNIALKFLPSRYTSDPELKARFMREAQAAAGLNHPNIITVHEVAGHKDKLYIAMEYVEGQTLKDLIAGKKLSVGQILDTALQISEGLAAAHRSGIIHRDVKPQNVLLGKDGRVKICDFGLAKVRKDAMLTQTGVPIGTVEYMSPEQGRGEQVDHRTDIWALGVVFYEMLVGQMPFRGEHDQAVIYSILNEEPLPPTSFRSDLPQEADRIINKALAKSADQRYQTMQEMLADLESLKREVESGLTTAASIESRSSPSIAVLPFVNMSPEKENEYFSDGVTEDIIAQLSKIGDLKVISRTSIMRYKQSAKSLREIGRELGVATILEGSVRKADNRVRIVSQLVDARTDEHVWSETYDRELEDIFEIQSDVAKNIAAALRAKVSPQERKHLEKRYTSDLTAYDYYLKGRDYYNRYHKEDNEIAMGFFKKASDIDPKYALAYAGLGDAYAQRALKFGFPEAWIDSAVEVSQRAIQIDPGLAEGHKALGLAYMVKNLFQEALEANHRAMELKPNLSPAVGNIGWIHWSRGEFKDALQYAKRAFPLNPTGAYQSFAVGSAYLMLDEYVKAEAWLNKALELQPDFGSAHVALMDLFLRRGKHERAAEQCQKLLAICPSDVGGLEAAGDLQLLCGELAQAKPYYEKALGISPTGLRGLTGTSLTTRLGYICWMSEQREEAGEMFTQRLDSARERLNQGDEAWDVRYDIACINAIKGNRVEALTWLRKAIDCGWKEYHSALRNPMLESIRGHQQFKQMMRKVRTQIDEMRRQVEEMEAE
jgi:serine/threonine protein kinase/Tfp pilus assembly protein PilF